ncbi:MAG: FAD-binding protein, partial [Bifidobacteriaceae bacterium]|jgi:hypothetical protein|nr:FAD-binding protein [Bifidobacteriaceae bacterium]
MDLGPHVSNIHYDVAFADTREPFCGSGGAQWLRVNIEGERFSDEDCAYQQIYAQDIDQPGQMHYQIMDAKHPDQWQLFYGGVMRGNGNTGPGPEASRDVWAAVLENAGEDPNQYENVYDLVVAGAIAAGIGFKADTIEGLATEMGVPPEALKATVDRYNELAAQGVDLDFGKNPDFLWPIDTPPYYALSRRAHPLGVLNGLRINTEMQVLDKDGEVIEALYAAGNNSGGNYFGGMVQPMCAPAMTTGRALLTGRLAALNAAGA